MPFTAAAIAQLIRDTGGIQVTYKGVTTWGHYETSIQEEFGDDVRGAGVTTEVPSVVIPTQAISAKQGAALSLVATAADGLGWLTKKVVVLWRQAEDDGATTRLGLAEA